MARVPRGAVATTAPEEAGGENSDQEKVWGFGFHAGIVRLCGMGSAVHRYWFGIGDIDRLVVGRDNGGQWAWICLGRWSSMRTARSARASG